MYAKQGEMHSRDEFHPTITMTELDRKLRTLLKSKTTGKDVLPNENISRMPTDALEKNSSSCRSITSRRVFPKDLENLKDNVSTKGKM
jgi:hypothetical protein